jgi:hypothetical protein
VLQQTTARNMFPPKPTKQRQRGVRKPQIAFRAPEHLERYIEGAESGGYTKTQVVIRMLEVAKDAAEGLGNDWFEIERIAAVEKTTPGVVLARLAKAGLERRPKK